MKFNNDFGMSITLSREEISKRVIMPVRIAVIVLSVMLITLITIDTLRNISFLADESYLKFQFWCCLAFEFDILLELILSENRWKYLHTHVLFILVSIPYLNVIHYFNFYVSPEWQYVLRFVPMLRAAYVFALVTGVTTSSRFVNTLFSTYLIVLIMIVYFCSLTFYVSEHYVNSGVSDYWSSLWWTIMSLTTAGCGIHAITPTGHVLGVVLSATGLILFPVFTVFLTNKFSDDKSGNVANDTSPDADKKENKTSTQSSNR